MRSDQYYRNLMRLFSGDRIGRVMDRLGVEEGEVIATAKSFFGLFKSVAKSPMTGSIESISSVTGQVLIRGPAIPVEVKAYLKGRVVDVFESEGV